MAVSCHHLPNSYFVVSLTNMSGCSKCNHNFLNVEVTLSIRLKIEVYVITSSLHSMIMSG